MLLGHLIFQLFFKNTIVLILAVSFSVLYSLECLLFCEAYQYLNFYFDLMALNITRFVTLFFCEYPFTSSFLAFYFFKY